ncbi:tail protein X [Escherichia coli]
MITYTTRDGDRLDQICLAVYGRASKTTEPVKKETQLWD